MNVHFFRRDYLIAEGWKCHHLCSKCVWVAGSQLGRVSKAQGCGAGRGVKLFILGRGRFIIVTKCPADQTQELLFGC